MSREALDEYLSGKHVSHSGLEIKDRGLYYLLVKLYKLSVYKGLVLLPRRNLYFEYYYGARRSIDP